MTETPGILSGELGLIGLFDLGQLLAFTFIAGMFFSLYKFLPNRKIRWRTALLASMFTEKGRATPL